MFNLLLATVDHTILIFFRVSQPRLFCWRFFLCIDELRSCNNINKNTNQAIKHDVIGNALTSLVSKQHDFSERSKFVFGSLMTHRLGCSILLVINRYAGHSLLSLLQKNMKERHQIQPEEARPYYTNRSHWVMGEEIAHNRKK